MQFWKKKGALGGNALSIPLAVVGGLAALVIGILVLLLTVNIIRTGGIISAGSVELGAINNLSANISAGVNSLAGYIPTVFIVAAVVMILGIIGLLYMFFKQKGGGGVM